MKFGHFGVSLVLAALTVGVTHGLPVKWTESGADTYIEYKGKTFDVSSGMDVDVDGQAIGDGDIFMMICDKAASLVSGFTCDLFNDCSHYGQIYNFQTSSDTTSYLHSTRCGGGVDATVVTSAEGNSYKSCSGFDNRYTVKSKYNVPPSLCLTQCNSDKDCVGYSTDSQYCYIWTQSTHNGCNSWVPLPSTT